MHECTCNYTFRWIYTSTRGYFLALRSFKSKLSHWLEINISKQYPGCFHSSKVKEENNLHLLLYLTQSMLIYVFFTTKQENSNTWRVLFTRHKQEFLLSMYKQNLEYSKLNI